MLEFEQNIPIYIQIMDTIKRDIATGKMRGGDKLPSVRELAARFKVNPNTAQRVYQELERENITYTQRGMGTFISEDADKLASLKKGMAKDIITAFLQGMKQLDFSNEEIVDMIKEHIGKEV